MFCMLLLEPKQRQNDCFDVAFQCVCVCRQDQRSKTEVSLCPLYERDNDQKKTSFATKTNFEKQLHEMMTVTKNCESAFFL